MPIKTTETDAVPANWEHSRTFMQDAFRRLIRNKVAIISATYILAMILIALLAPVVAPYSYGHQNLARAFEGPSAEFLFGTDRLGRCILSRVIWGSRVSLGVGFGVTFITVVIGVIMGLVSGYFGGWVDSVTMRLTDITFAFPGLLFAILIMALLGPGLLNVFIALSITGWASLARLVRSQVLSIRETEFVEAARAIGAKNSSILTRHVLANITGPIIVSSTMTAGTFILGEASLSFLGVGVKPPFPSWGSMISGATDVFLSHPYMLFFPSLALAGLILSFNFLGDSLRDALDPKLKA